MCNFNTQFHPGLLSIVIEYISGENSMAINSKGPGMTEPTVASGPVRGWSNLSLVRADSPVHAHQSRSAGLKETRGLFPNRQVETR